jgi:hypothetical protein
MDLKRVFPEKRVRAVDAITGKSLACCPSQERGGSLRAVGVHVVDLSASATSAFGFPFV